MLFLFYKMFNPPISILSGAWISVVAWWLAVPKENTKNATQCLWLKQILKRLSLASGVLWVYTTSANMKVLIFCPVLVFLLLRSALGEDTGESECSHSRLQLHQQPACCKKKKKNTLSETESADCSVLCCEMLIIQFLFCAAEEVNVTVWHHTSSSC